MLVFLLCLLTALSTFGDENSPKSVDVKIDAYGFKNNSGRMLASLFIAKSGFPSDHSQAFQTSSAAITNLTASAIFTNVPLVSFAVAICHDFNDNGRMDKDILGRPLEGYGVSGKPAKTRTKPPKFEDSKLTITPSNTTVEIEIIYP